MGKASCSGGRHQSSGVHQKAVNAWLSRYNIPMPKITNINGLGVQVTRKKMKRLRMRVAGDGTVQVSAPLTTSDAEITRFVQANADWIAQQQRKLADSPIARATAATPAELAEMRTLVEAATRMLLEKWEPALGVRVKTLAFRNMTSRWGSCKPSTGRVCINIRLALYPPRCLEYVVVHELCHFHVQNHGPEFKALLDQHLPDWRETQKLLRG